MNDKAEGSKEVDPMPSPPYRVVTLLRNHLYPTYQLYAQMSNRKTSPEDGLKLAALTTLDWLRRRLGSDVPPELQLPGPESYRDCPMEEICSFHINHGFVIDVISLPEEGIWSLQVTEPDLGSDPGNPAQTRGAVPGRIIETNIGFRIVQGQLQCGFRTVISDVEGTLNQAEVYRLAVVKRLANDPAFGLKQTAPLSAEASTLSSMEQLKRLTGLLRAEDCHLPAVVFTHPRREAEPLKYPPLTEDLLSREAGSLLTRVVEVPLPAGPLPVPYDVDSFARSGLALCRTYVLEDALLERAQALWKVKFQPGDVLLMEPGAFGGKIKVFSYRPKEARQTYQRLKKLVYQYPLGKAICFGKVCFLSDARDGLVRQIERNSQQTASLSDSWSQKLEAEKARDQEKSLAAEARLRVLTEQVERQKAYVERLEKEKEALRQEFEEKLEKERHRLDGREAYYAFLERKLDRPNSHGEIAAWVKRHFTDRLLLHPKAEAMLKEKSAATVDLNLICDALDFLATDHWEQRYHRLSKEEVLTRCGEKYGRPFDVSPIGAVTIDFTPGQYKIKYFTNEKGERIESPLKFHLRVGNDMENLLRIYFLYDDEKQCIVVGSLPRHLRTVTIQ